MSKLKPNKWVMVMIAFMVVLAASIALAFAKKGLYDLVRLVKDSNGGRGS